MNKNKFLVALVLDRSGSMQGVADDTIGGVNRFITEQAALPGECLLTMVQFDTQYEFICKGLPIKDATPLTSETYVPRGSTALLDAMGRCIDETGVALKAMPEGERPGRVIFTVVTDGHENASREYTRDAIAAKVKHQTEKYGWEFVFLGANMDAIAAGAGIGVNAASSASYANNSVGIDKAYRIASRKVAASRAGAAMGQSVSMDWSPAERNELLDPTDPPQK